MGEPWLDVETKHNFDLSIVLVYKITNEQLLHTIM